MVQIQVTLRRQDDGMVGMNANLLTSDPGDYELRVGSVVWKAITALLPALSESDNPSGLVEQIIALLNEQKR